MSTPKARAAERARVGLAVGDAVYRQALATLAGVRRAQPEAARLYTDPAETRGGPRRWDHLANAEAAAPLRLHPPLWLAPAARELLAAAVLGMRDAAAAVPLEAAGAPAAALGATAFAAGAEVWRASAPAEAADDRGAYAAVARLLSLTLPEDRRGEAAVAELAALAAGWLRGLAADLAAGLQGEALHVGAADLLASVSRAARGRGVEPSRAVYVEQLRELSAAIARPRKARARKPAGAAAGAADVAAAAADADGLGAYIY